ncbi:hypothetical protein M3J09_002397 [Ascochyta lentis]
MYLVEGFSISQSCLSIAPKPYISAYCRPGMLSFIRSRTSAPSSAKSRAENGVSIDAPGAGAARAVLVSRPRAVVTKSMIGDS